MADPSRVSDHLALDADLLDWGWVISLETRGRRSGLPRRVTVGFVEGPEGALMVAASAEATGWALNLLEDPTCRVGRKGAIEARRAVPLSGGDRDDAVRALILKYGTPSESLGAGPAFRLDEVEATH